MKMFFVLLLALHLMSCSENTQTTTIIHFINPAPWGGNGDEIDPQKPYETVTPTVYNIQGVIMDGTAISIDLSNTAPETVFIFTVVFNNQVIFNDSYHNTTITYNMTNSGHYLFILQDNGTGLVYTATFIKN